MGKETLLKLRERGPECKLVGLELQSDATATTTQQVIANGRTIGEIALGFRGLTVGKNLAWAYVAQGHTRAGTQALVAFKDRNVQATIVDIRCYDPNDTRIRS